MQTEFTGEISAQTRRSYFDDEQLSIKFSSPMANQFHKFYLSQDEINYLSCTESKWTIMSPTLRYLLHAVRFELKQRGYDNLIIKNSLSDYSKSRELTFPVSLFCLMRGLMLPPALAAENGDVTFRSDFNDNGAPRTRAWKKRFNDAVDRYYTNRFVDMSITRPNIISMSTPPSEVLIKAYFQVIFQKPNRVDLKSLYVLYGLAEKAPAKAKAPAKEKAPVKVKVEASAKVETPAKDEAPVKIEEVKKDQKYILTYNDFDYTKFIGIINNSNCIKALINSFV